MTGQHAIFFPYFVLVTATLQEKPKSVNGHGIIAVTGGAHCQRQVAFFIRV